MVSLPALFVAGLCGLAELTWAFNLTSTGSTVILNGIPYYIPATSAGSIPEFDPHILAGTKSVFGGLVPVTVVEAPSVTFNLQNLKSTIKKYGKEDDVWGVAFLSGMVCFDIYPLEMNLARHSEICS